MVCHVLKGFFELRAKQFRSIGILTYSDFRLNLNYCYYEEHHSADYFCRNRSDH